MKWITRILIIYLVALFGVPCSDAAVVHAETLEISQSLNHNHDSEDHCSPFCACACCGVTMTFLKINLPTFNVPLQEFGADKQLAKNYSVVSNYQGSIWQPPKFNV